MTQLPSLDPINISPTTGTAPFDAHPERYDEWFERHQVAYWSELRAREVLLAENGDGLEIGVGTGRFAAPLGLEHGVDPSPAMRERAQERGIDVREGTADALPYPDARFDKTLMTATLCYLDGPPQAFREAPRVLRPEGALVVGFVDRAHLLGQKYTHSDSFFYKDARFHGASEVLGLLKTASFEGLTIRQILFSDGPDSLGGLDPVREGFGEGVFVAVRGQKLDRRDIPPKRGEAPR